MFLGINLYSIDFFSEILFLNLSSIYPIVVNTIPKTNIKNANDFIYYRNIIIIIFIYTMNTCKKPLYNRSRLKFKKLTKKFKKNNYIIYKKNILPKKLFQKIVNITNDYKNELKTDNFTKSRYGLHIPKKSKIYSIIYSKKFKSMIEKIVNTKLEYSDFPIEYRLYPENSDGMPWHSDLKLYTKPQYELVFTIMNNSDSKTVWKKDNKQKDICTEPNSLIIVRANAAEHKVTPLYNGERSILKFIYAPKLAKVNEEKIKQEFKRYD